MILKICFCWYLFFSLENSKNAIADQPVAVIVDDFDLMDQIYRLQADPLIKHQNARILKSAHLHPKVQKELTYFLRQIKVKKTPGMLEFHFHKSKATDQVLFHKVKFIM